MMKLCSVNTEDEVTRLEEIGPLSTPARPSGFDAESLERIVMCAAMFLLSGAVFPLLHSPGATLDVTVGGDSVGVAATGIAYVATGLFALQYGSQILSTIRQSGWVWLLTGLALASAAWSTDRDVSLRSGLALCATALFGAYFGTRFTPRQQVALLSTMFGVTAVLSIAFVLLTDYGILPGAYTGAWRGVFDRKNTLGDMMALAFLVFILRSQHLGTWKPLAWLFAALALALVVLSQSMGGLVLGGFVLLFVAAIPMVRRRTIPAWLLLCVGFFVVAGIAALLWWRGGEVLTVLGRDPTLTGRTLIWALVLTKISVHPILGYGVNAFWRGRSADYVDIWRAVGWPTPHSHNGFLDLALDLGAVGIGVFLVCYFQAVVRGLRFLRNGTGIEGSSWPLAYLVFFLLVNLTEVRLLRNNSLFWILFISTASTVARGQARDPGGPNV